MKKITLLLILFTNTLEIVQGQTLDSLRKVKVKLENNVSQLNDSIKKINTQITALETKSVLKKIQESSLKVVCRNEAKLRKNPHVLSPINSTLAQGTIVTILDYVDGYLGVCSDTICGYLNDIWIKPTEESNRFIEMKKEELANLQKTIADKKLLENIEQEKIYIKKYGNTTYNKLKQGKFWLGMNQEMTIISLNYPEKINRTVNIYGVFEQWVYTDTYLYFENGILTSYQD